MFAWTFWKLCILSTSYKERLQSRFTIPPRARPAVPGVTVTVLFVLHAPPASSERDGTFAAVVRRGDERRCVGLEMNASTWYRAFPSVWPTIKWPWKLRFLKYPLLTGFYLTSSKIPRKPPAVRRNQFAHYTAYSPSPTHSYPRIDTETYSKSRLRLGNKNQNFSL
jgi:hypothetical protein